MKLGKLITEERELIFRSLVLSGVHIVATLSNPKGQFDFSEEGMAEQDVREIHFTQPLQVIVQKMESLGFKFKGIVDGWHVFAPAKHVLHHPGFSGIFERGDVVQLNTSYKNSPAGTKAFVNKWKDGRILLITERDDEICLYQREQIDNLIYLSSNNKFLDFFRDSKQ